MRHLVIVLVVGSAAGCAAIKSGLANVSAARIRTCSPEQLVISDTSGTDPVKGPKWTATCGAQVFECQGYMQLPDTVRCARLQ